MRREPVPPTLDDEVVHYLEDAGEILEFSAGDPIIRRGDAGSTFFVVLSGLAEVRLVGEDGQAIPLRQLGAGAFFGEMSILTGEPVSADVIATESATLLSYPRDRFSTAMGECEPLRDQVMAGMASNLRGSSTDVWNLKQRAEALSEFLDSGTRSGPVIAQSAKMRAVVGAIDRLAADQSPTLIHGDAGTGKLFIAHKLHERTHIQETPFIVVDCRELSEGDAHGVLVGTSDFGGHEEEPSSAESLHRYGAIHLASRVSAPPAVRRTSVTRGPRPMPAARSFTTRSTPATLTCASSASTV
jgi:CRP-like cAMP-binding protein